MKLLTVTIPCYNSQDYMAKAIESALLGGDDVEILVVDDGSKDDTLSIAQQYESKYPHIVRAIHKENNSEIFRTIKKIIKVVTCILVPLGTILFLHQLLFLNVSLEDAVVKTVAALIGMIPEGLVLLTRTFLFRRKGF